MKNLAFARKITKKRIQAMLDAAGVTNTFSMYHFQDDEPTQVGSYNNGTSGMLGNMAWSNFGLATGDGWYAPHRGASSAGMTGRGMVNDGGVSGYYGSVSNHSGNNIAGEEKATFIFIVKPNSDGEGNFGRVFQRGDSGYALFLRNDSGTACEPVLQLVDGGGINQMGTTGTPLPNDEWSVLVYTFDGTQALGSRTKLYINGIKIAVTNDVMDANLVDSADILYILDRSANDRAFDGNLGLLAIIPGYTFTQADVDSIQEIRGLFQPTVTQQPVIYTPGSFGGSEYSFDGVADPNSDNFFTRQITSIKTLQGTVLMWLSVESIGATTLIFGVNEEGAALDSFFVNIQPGNVFSIVRQVSGITQIDLRFGSGDLQIGVPAFVAFTSDGSTIRGFFNGEERTVTVTVGSNDGSWFGDVPDCDVFSIGAHRRSTLSWPMAGAVQNLIIRDDVLSPIQIAKMAQSSALGWQRFVG